MRRSSPKLRYWILPVLIACAALSCGKGDRSTRDQQNTSWQNKIAFDLSQIRPDGLTGPPDGLVSVSYEFCIPKDDNALKLVLAIDPTIRHTPTSPGRVGCGKKQFLCMGDTHNPQWYEILHEIALLDFVTRIERTDWE